MRQSEPISHPEPPPKRVLSSEWVEGGPGRAPADPDGRKAPDTRRCAECGEPGLRWNAKVHPGRCARKRKTRMEKSRRRRRGIVSYALPEEMPHQDAEGER